MNGERLRQVKHELRTPLNHILGYSDLLLDAAEDLNDEKMGNLAKRIKSQGEILSRTLERGLASGGREADRIQIDLLRSNIRPVVEDILAILATDPELSQKEEFSADVQRIREAVTQFVNLLKAVPGG
jgi:K+-sensing histidine kinase KdpD